MLVPEQYTLQQKQVGSSLHIHDTVCHCTTVFVVLHGTCRYTAVDIRSLDICHVLYKGGCVFVELIVYAGLLLQHDFAGSSSQGGNPASAQFPGGQGGAPSFAMRPPAVPPPSEAQLGGGGAHDGQPLGPGTPALHQLHMRDNHQTHKHCSTVENSCN